MKKSLPALWCGQSIYEVVLAIGIVTSVLVAIVALVVVTQRNASLAKNRAAGIRLTQAASEWLRAERNTDWNVFYSNAATQNWCLNDLSWGNSGACSDTEFITGNEPFRRQVNFVRTTLPNGLQVRADVNIVWLDQQGTHTQTSSTYFTNWQ